MLPYLIAGAIGFGIGKLFEEGGETFGRGGITTNEGIIKSFLNSNKELRVGNLEAVEIDDIMYLRNYRTFIAKRMGDKVKISSQKYSKTTSTITNRLKALAQEMGYSVEYVSEKEIYDFDKFAGGGEVEDLKSDLNKYKNIDIRFKLIPNDGSEEDGDENDLSINYIGEIYGGGLDLDEPYVELGFQVNDEYAGGGRITKYVKLYFVQGNYGQGFEDLTAHDNRKDAISEMRVYDDNESYPHRVIERRVLRSDYEKGKYDIGGEIIGERKSDMTPIYKFFREESEYETLNYEGEEYDFNLIFGFHNGGIDSESGNELPSGYYARIDPIGIGDGSTKHILKKNDFEYSFVGELWNLTMLILKAEEDTKENKNQAIKIFKEKRTDLINEFKEYINDYVLGTYSEYAGGGGVGADSKTKIQITDSEEGGKIATRTLVKKNQKGESITYELTVGVFKDRKKGYFEIYATDSEDDEYFYAEGGLWIEGGRVVDYDGVYELSEKLRPLMSALNLNTQDVYAEGGMIEHGLRVGDEILEDFSQDKNDDEILVLNHKEHKGHIVNLDKGERYADGGLAKKRRRRANIQTGRTDRSVDKTRVGKPVGYRFSNSLASKLRKDKYAVPTEKQITKYLGKGIYKENRKNRSDKDRTAKL